LALPGGGAAAFDISEPVDFDARTARTDAPDAYIRTGFGKGSGRIPIAYDVAYRLVIVVAP